MSRFFYGQFTKGRDIIALKNFNAFRAEVRKQLSLRGWKYKDLATATGYTVKTIESFMCASRTSDGLADAIAKALDIPAYMAT